MIQNVKQYYRNLDTPEFNKTIDFQKDSQNTGKKMIDKIFNFILED